MGEFTIQCQDPLHVPSWPSNWLDGDWKERNSIGSQKTHGVQSGVRKAISESRTMLVATSSTCWMVTAAFRTAPFQFKQFFCLSAQTQPLHFFRELGLPCASDAVP